MDKWLECIGLIGGMPEVVSGIYQCTYNYDGDARLLMSIAWILRMVWEVLVMCLVVWVVVKHFRQLRLSSQAGIIGDCFTILMKTHAVYFVRLVATFTKVIFLCWSSTRSSFVAGFCITLHYFFSTVSVCWPLADICVSPFIISIGLKFHRLQWCPEHLFCHTDVCARTTPHP